MGKVKVLFVSDDKHEGGVEYHRLIVPMHNMGEDFDITRINTLHSDDIKPGFFRDYQIVLVSRTLSTVSEEKIQSLAKQIHNEEAKIILDIDDYWRYPSSHHLYDEHKRVKVPQLSEESIRVSDMVTTTNYRLADKIGRINKRVEILRNAVDPKQPQWQGEHTEAERIRFGWIGGICHEEDVRILQGAIERINKDFELSKKIAIGLGGFNNDELSKLMYPRFEAILTDDFKTLRFDKEYIRYLRMYTPLNNDNYLGHPYFRMWGMDVHNYGYMYDYIDVALAPLVENTFNSCKSELKMIEAGIKGVPIIVSEVFPYMDCAINEKNCLTAKHPVDWYLKMKKMADNKELRTELAHNLTELVKTQYVIDIVNEKRKHIYKHLAS